LKVITKLPLSKLVTPRGDAARGAELGAEAIRQLLRWGPVRFVIADIGHELRWLEEASCLVTWKQEVQPHLAEPQ